MSLPTAAHFGILPTFDELLALRPAPGNGRLRLPPTSTATGPGRHAAPLRSRGMEFSEARPYQSGDDVRSIDWRQTARRGRLYTKLFDEEHERPVILLTDLGPNMRFGTRAAFKSVIAARIAAWLAWRAIGAGDRVGGLLWNGQQAREIRPQGREHGALSLLHGLIEASLQTPPAPAQPLSVPLRQLARRLHKGSLIVLISDFADLDGESHTLIRALGRSTELVLIQLYDCFEAEAPPPGHYPVSDGKDRLTLNLVSSADRAAHGAAFAHRRAALEAVARTAAIPLLALATDCDLERSLAAAFLGRSRGKPLAA